MLLVVCEEHRNATGRFTQVSCIESWIAAWHTAPMAGAVARYILQFVNDCGESIETFESATPFHAFAEGQAVELHEHSGAWEVDAVSHSIGHTRDQRTLIVQMTVHLRERN